MIFSGMHQFWANVDMGVSGKGGVRWVVVTAREKKLNNTNDRV